MANRAGKTNHTKTRTHTFTTCSYHPRTIYPLVFSDADLRFSSNKVQTIYNTKSRAKAQGVQHLSLSLHNTSLTPPPLFF